MQGGCCWEKRGGVDGGPPAGRRRWGGNWLVGQGAGGKVQAARACKLKSQQQNEAVCRVMSCTWGIKPHALTGLIAIVLDMCCMHASPKDL